MRRIFLLVFTTFTIAAAYSQSVELNFPHFAGQKWHFRAFRGEGKDTIATGTLDGQGRAKLVLPDRMNGFRGMTQWQLTGGGGLDMIFAGGENFSVSCPEAQPSEETIVYTGTRENVYLNSRYRRQQDILGRIDAMRMAAEAYKDNNELLSIFNTELQNQEQAYTLLQEETAANPLYAARFAQVVDVTRGLPPVLASGQEEIAGLLKDFVLDRLDPEALYTSGHWAGVLEQLMDWYSYKEENRPAFISDMIRLVNRISSDEAYAALCEKVIVFCEKKGWHDQQIEFAFFLLNDDRIKEPEGKVASVYTLLKIRKGSKAPALSQGKLPEGKTLLVFYESGCNACENEMQQLKGNYPLLREKGYEVVSVAADKDEAVFKNTSGTFPWKARYCDFRGFGGTDFTTFGVIGTPTFYVIDGQGILQGRYARLADTGILN
ncbi:redoxin domain-containing protein [Dysgonomonas termitidis]|uniref:Redoxin domain-containing protein n=1 Tax=Dysgonomonas termitidis TaxID=1516126 RepID=A0ABV9KQB3_9BACT